MKNILHSLALCTLLLLAFSCSDRNTPVDTGTDIYTLPTDPLANASTQLASAAIQNCVDGFDKFNCGVWSLTWWKATNDWIWVYYNGPTVSLYFQSFFEINPMGTSCTPHEQISLAFGDEDWPVTTRTQVIDYFKTDYRVSGVTLYDNSSIRFNVRNDGSAVDSVALSLMPTDPLAYTSVALANAQIQTILDGKAKCNDGSWTILWWKPTYDWIFVTFNGKRVHIALESYFEIKATGTSGKAHEKVSLAFGDEDWPATTQQQILDYYKQDSRVSKAELNGQGDILVTLK